MSTLRDETVGHSGEGKLENIALPQNFLLIYHRNLS